MKQQIVDNLKQLMYVGVMGTALAFSPGVSYASSSQQYETPSSRAVVPLSERLLDWVSEAKAQSGPYRIHTFKEGDLHVMVGYNIQSEVPLAFLRVWEVGNPGSEAKVLSLYGSDMIPDSFDSMDNELARYVLGKAGVVPPVKGEVLRDFFPERTGPKTLADRLN